LKNFRIKTTDASGSPTSFEVTARDEAEAKQKVALALATFRAPLLAVEEVSPEDTETEI